MSEVKITGISATGAFGIGALMSIVAYIFDGPEYMRFLLFGAGLLIIVISAIGPTLNND